MYKLGFTIVLTYVSVNCAHPTPEDGIDNYEWDVMVFTQQWPETACREWVHQDSSHTCNMPKKADSWTIHGIWPDKLHTKGPNFCNRTWHFDPEQVRPIETELINTWTNIEAETEKYSFWAHEWTKHGTCAAQLESLNSEFKYFSTGLKWFEKYNMGSILAKNGIVPDDSKQYSFIDIHNAVKNTLGVNPSVQCRMEDGNNYLAEIRVCVDKKLELINCDGITKWPIMSFQNLNFVTNCSAKKSILYPHNKWPINKVLVELYRLIYWLQWYTL